MGQMTHRIMFLMVFFIGAGCFFVAILDQFILSIQNITQWSGPIGLGMLIIGITGSYITSKRHQRRKFKEVEVEQSNGDNSKGYQGQRFQDYISSPEEAITVYTLFLAGFVIIVWGGFMIVRWFRTLF